ncbi:hypothetical protein CYY_003105 [Polysphondylium violaceum]|uniref:intramembrane prenyl-peptidase Rce1 n=1 Tax=Polysphondylium violaceum TaxID=133409 RepID=A0A8J4V0F6_9MYCE|nr:hypothetical protein CYY_003105 [Polysphondylium violaceum]
MSDNQFYTKKEFLPELGSTTSLVTCILLALFFVLSLYFRNPSRNRNDPIVMRKRINRVLAYSVFCLVFFYFFIPNSNYKLNVYLKLIGIPSLGFDLITQCFYPLLLTMILFLGPLLMYIFDEEDKFTFNFDLEFFRDIVVGPSVEEICFRAVICPLLFFGGYHIRSIIIFSPILFGFAHFHHIFPIEKDTIVRKLLIITLQLCFTSLFGMYSAFIFFRTGNLLACILTHAFCNSMGFPNFGDLPDHPKKNSNVFHIV